MPPRNTVKKYLENGYYHIYNRGVEKRDIFLDDQDYRVFLHLLKFYLSPLPKQNQKTHPLSELSGIIPVRLHQFETLYKEIELMAYCLISNHFHLLLKQSTIDGITKLLRRISTTYSMYFNKRNKRVGHLFQGIYKAVLIEEDSYLLHLSRYIHLNPTHPDQPTGIIPVNYPYSSYGYYLGNKSAPWIKPQFILNYFNQSARTLLPKNVNSYQKFVEDYFADSREFLGSLVLEE